PGRVVAPRCRGYYGRVIAQIIRVQHATLPFSALLARPGRAARSLRRQDNAGSVPSCDGGPLQDRHNIDPCVVYPARRCSDCPPEITGCPINEEDPEVHRGGTTGSRPSSALTHWSR